MEEYGYIAFSHNTEIDELQLTREDKTQPTYEGGFRGGGVLIAVDAQAAIGAREVYKDQNGRALLVEVRAEEVGQTVGVLAIYGPHGAWSERFIYDATKMRAERSLRRAIDEALTYCRNNNMPLLIGGDLNAFTDAALDNRGGGNQYTGRQYRLPLTKTGSD